MATHEEKTVALKACSECRAALLEPDKFCRWCGVKQARTSESASSHSLVTSPLTDPDLYHLVSGPLVNAMVKGVVENRARSCGAFTRKLILGLVSIPIWLIIVLLSPIDAYTSAKTIAGRL